MRICQIFISKTVGQQQQNDGVGTVAITFSPWSGHERMFLKSGINRQRLAFNFDLLPYNLMEIFKCTDKGPDKCFV